MELNDALQILETEYERNRSFDLETVADKLQFLIALTVVQQGLDCGSLTEMDYVKKVIKILE